MCERAAMVSFDQEHSARTWLTHLQVLTMWGASHAAQVPALAASIITITNTRRGLMEYMGLEKSSHLCMNGVKIGAA